jgi:hypothetical protein
MVLKRKNKVPKRLKKGMRGGDSFQDWFNKMKSQTDSTFEKTIESIYNNLGINMTGEETDDDKSIIYQWATFIKFINDPKSIPKNDEYYTLNDDDITKLSTIAAEVRKQRLEREESLINEEKKRKEIKTKLGIFRSLGRIVSQIARSARSFGKRPGTAAVRRQGDMGNLTTAVRPQSALAVRPQSALGERTMSFSINPSVNAKNAENAENEHTLILNVEEDISEKGEKIIMLFNTVFLNILVKVNDDRKNSKKTKEFKSIMMLVNNLPDIDTTLPALVDIKQNTLKERYKKILDLLNQKCSGWRGTICSSAASLLGNQIYQIYINLKNNTKNTEISTENLIDFIIDVLPIMMSKLESVSEFTDDHAELIKINNMLGLPVPASTKGGKKSSKSVHKELQGKLMKIYRKPNDKKDYVKHKGVLISIKEYKEHMKQRAAITKKVILGKERCIYKVQGSNKEHVKYKGSLIPVADFKKLMKV